MVASCKVVSERKVAKGWFNTVRKSGKWGRVEEKISSGSVEPVRRASVGS